jgi:hypothetical protein
MEVSKIKKIVSIELKKGNPLPKIQKMLQDKCNFHIVLLDLMSIALGFEDIDWGKLDAKQKYDGEIA